MPAAPMSTRAMVQRRIERMLVTISVLRLNLDALGCEFLADLACQFLFKPMRRPSGGFR